jgi:alkylhydroperoxidase/carboxymuconolactone decarboxylase family protein YurZ
MRRSVQAWVDGCFHAALVVGYSGKQRREETLMQIRKKILDYEYEEALDVKTRELIRVGCAVAVGCPT